MPETADRTDRTTGKPRRVVKSADQRRSDLMDAALEVFASKGFERTTVDDIADAAGAGKGTFYRHFTSKDHLLGALWQRYVDTLLATAEVRLDEAGRRWSLPVLEAIFTELIAVAVQNADLHRLVYASSSGPAHDICRAANQRVVSELADYVEAGAAAGEVTTGYPRFVLGLLYEGLDATLDQLIATGDRTQLDGLAERFLPTLRAGLGIVRDPNPARE
ncbi:TetR/AcrR family transcriptional regulator [Enemella evansiae]|uniref:TetR/AcrR family transcriptional regulator n=1 Tax=Enemella evansiae TaxID=2016499 RepID=UPI000B97AE49|nr:TetR/AcrR family transcriptional regulator [Enemella evansiae]OYO03372.1 hypothetical protein CGZ97_07860 [Enemella evansiae]